MSTLHKSLAALALAGLAMNAHAHRPWLLPSTSVVDAKEAWVTVDAAISEDLFVIDHQPLKLDAVVATGPDGARVNLENAQTGKLRSTFDLRLAKPGTYKIGMVALNVSGSYKDKAGETKRFRGTEESMAKDVPADAQDLKVSRTHSRLETFVTTGTPNDTVFKPTGVGLELVPLTHPAELRAGEKASWRFLLDGKPAANQAFSLIPGGVRHRGTLGEIRQSTDAKGEISFTVPEAGVYLVSSSWPVAAPAVPGQPPQMPARRATYAATLEILPQ
ncbi:DUF4198 domain-containing protein [Oxalobacteraceae bacterium]|nr:DUF4198 domain-containing protein [Oxalobacteraceae bacterium]